MEPHRALALRGVHGHQHAFTEIVPQSHWPGFLPSHFLWVSASFVGSHRRQAARWTGCAPHPLPAWQVDVPGQGWYTSRRGTPLRQVQGRAGQDGQGPEQRWDPLLTAEAQRTRRNHNSATSASLRCNHRPAPGGEPGTVPDGRALVRPGACPLAERRCAGAGAGESAGAEPLRVCAGESAPVY